MEEFPNKRRKERKGKKRIKKRIKCFGIQSAGGSSIIQVQRAPQSMIFSRYLLEEVADDEGKERRGNKTEEEREKLGRVAGGWGVVDWTPPTEDLPSLTA